VIAEAMLKDTEKMKKERKRIWKEVAWKQARKPAGL